ncbi:M48 family metallopeptidase [Chloroflexota bacterium]
MTNTVTVEINNVGLVLFEHSKRAKRIIISVRPIKGVRVAVPYGSSFKKAMESVHTKEKWIKANFEKIKRYERSYSLDSNASEKSDMKQAKLVLTGRLQQLAAKHEFTYNRVFIRNQKTRWGSCSSKNNISLNMKLVKLPEELIDYVILHELAHTRKKDHSKAFWAEMDKLVGDGKKMAKILRNYGLILY